MQSWKLFLEIVGLINASYLTAAFIWPKLMISKWNYQRRAANMRMLGFSTLRVPAPWLGWMVRSVEGQQSWWHRHSLPVPVALLGAGVYLTLTLLSVFEPELHVWCKACGLAEMGITPLMTMWSLSLFGVLFSARMMYLMFGKAPKLLGMPMRDVWCAFCVVSASIMVITWLMDTARVLAGQ